MSIEKGGFLHLIVKVKDDLVATRVIKVCQGGHVMKIAEATIQLNSNYSYFEKHETRESLTVWKNGQEVQALTGDGNRKEEIDVEKLLATQGEDTVSLSPEVLQRRPVKAVAQPVPSEDSVMVDLNIRILKEMIERFTGKKILLSKPGPENLQEVPSDVTTEQSEVSPLESGVGIAYDYYESHYEYETTQFSSEGTILTEDGIEIDFSLELNMSREFYTEQNISIRAGEALKDPLVINFDGNAAELTQRHFAFDIDADGHEDQIAFVTPESGFLTLDKNGDNVINDGRELFGAITGDGFGELATYDDDGNNWIDENDSIYDSLRIWSKSEGGDDRLLALGQKGIGAIYLGHAETPFSLKGNENELLGQVRSSGFYLNESGMSGSVQQVDLVA